MILHRTRAGQRTRDLLRFVEGVCQNLGLDIEGAESGTHTRDLIEHVAVNLS